MKTTSDQEKLLALMDGELDEQTLEALLDQAEQNPELLDKWSDLHLQQASRQHWPVVDVAAGVNRDIDRLAVQRRAYRGHELKGMAIGALAAAVVLSVAALVAWPALQGGGGVPVSGQPELSQAPQGNGDLESYWRVHAQYATYQPGARWDETRDMHGGSSPEFF